MIDWVDLAWITSSVAGMLIAGVGVVEGWRDWHALGTETNGRRDLALDYLRTQSGRLVLAFMWLLLGVPLLFDAEPVTLNFFTGLLIFGNALLAVLAFASLRTRRKVFRRYE